MAAPNAGWYPDPLDPAQVRWWDGDGWTDNARAHPAASFEQPVPSPVMAAAPVAPPAEWADSSTAAEGSGARTAVITPVSEASLSATRLAPFPANAPERDEPEPAEITSVDQKDRTSRPLIALRVGAVALILVVGAALFSSGRLDGILGADGGTQRQASNDLVRVVDGDGYSIEVPKDWKQLAGVPEHNVDTTFERADGVGLAIAVDHDVEHTETLSDPAARAAVFDVVARVQTAVLSPQATVVSRATSTLDAEPAELIILEGPTVDGASVRLWEVGAVRDGTVYLLVFVGPTEAAATQEITFQTIASSLRFE